MPSKSIIKIKIEVVSILQLSVVMYYKGEWDYWENFKITKFLLNDTKEKGRKLLLSTYVMVKTITFRKENK